MQTHFEKESPFNFDDLFFSRTDRMGVIKAGNAVFQRVSKYEWNDLLEKPHSMIRHPAMPRGVFHLLWEKILAGNSIGAYVVNRAKDHSYYWVFALVSPIPGGFLSVRLKPSSSIFGIVQSKYVELLALEKVKKLTPKESQKLLLEEIQKLNFRDYKQFMTEALMQELESRQVNLNLPPLKILTQMRSLLSLGTTLQSKCKDIFVAYRKSALVPLNLEIKANQIGKDAASLAVISSQYDDLAHDIQDETKKFLEAGDLVKEKVEACQFEVSNSLLQKEMVSFFKNSNENDCIDKNQEMNFLENSALKGIQKATDSLSSIVSEFTNFRFVYEEVNKLALALEIVSLTGKIESAKIQQSTELNSLLSDLSTFKAELRKVLKEIDTIGTDLVDQTQNMKSHLAIR